jgi:hypothetical protein
VPPCSLIGNYESNCQRRTKKSSYRQASFSEIFKGAEHSFVVPLQIDKNYTMVKDVYCAFGRRFQICSLHLCQSLHDVKAQTRQFALLPIVFRIANQRVKEALVNFEGISHEGGQAEITEISVPVSLMKIYPMTSLSARSI